MALPDGMRLLERFTLTAPLGVRFWDVAAGEAVRGGMTLQGFPVDNPDRTLRAFSNGSGVMVFRDLPGLRDPDPGTWPVNFRFGDGSDAFWQQWQQPSRTRRFELTAIDEQRRFLPLRFGCDAPQRGFARCVCPARLPPASHLVPNAPLDALPVYSASTRHAPAGLAVIRAQMLEPPDIGSPPADRVPAAWAFVEALLDGDVVGSSYADEQGRVAVMFPFPAPADSSLISPPSPPDSSGAGGLLKQRWRIVLRAYYDRLPRGEVPDLCDLLAQRPATLWDNADLIDPLAARELAYAAELTIRSRDRAGSPGDELSELLITPVP
jgi:hypothetical protein